jgi:hypothetical protein
MEKKIGYKGFNVDSNNVLDCRGFKFEAGKDYKTSGKLEMCGNGFHFCWNLNDVHNFYNLGSSVICEVEILGDIENDSDMTKSCTNHIKIVRLLTKEEVLKISNTGRDNTGFINGGSCNSGNGNSGNWNSGNWNSGDWNSGNWNSGDWNGSDYNNGFFNTKENEVYIFNRPSGMTAKEFKNSKYYNALTEYCPILTEWIYYTDEEKANDKAKELIGGCLKRHDYKEAHKTWWNKLSTKSKKTIQTIPNFEKATFEEITGINAEVD